MTDKQEENENKATETDIKPSIRKHQTEPEEIGGPGGPEPTRYGDWERRGRCIDF